MGVKLSIVKIVDKDFLNFFYAGNINLRELTDCLKLMLQNISIQ